jgi:hypothetical protein
MMCVVSYQRVSNQSAQLWLTHQHPQRRGWSRELFISIFEGPTTTKIKILKNLQS